MAERQVNQLQILQFVTCIKEELLNTVKANKPRGSCAFRICIICQGRW